MFFVDAWLVLQLINGSQSQVSYIRECGKVGKNENSNSKICLLDLHVKYLFI